MESANLKAVLMLILCTFFWGMSFPVGKHALYEVSALTLILWRFAIAAACLAVYIRWLKIPVPRLSAKKWGWVVLVSIVGVGGLNIGLFPGLARTEASNGALIMALSPLFTSLIGSALQRKMPAVSAVFSLVVCLFGVLLVLTNGEFARLLGFQFNLGDKMIFAGMLCWSLYTYFTHGISKWMPVVPFTLLGMLSGAGAILALILFSGDVHFIQESMHASLFVVVDIAFIGVFGTVGGYLLWLNGVKELGASTASLFFNFVPVFAALSALLYGQRVAGLQLVGMFIVIAGLILPRVYSFLVTKNGRAKVLNIEKVSG